MSASSSDNSASSITVSETLELLEGEFSAFARGVARGRYTFWLGSGISLRRVPGLRELIRKVLTFLHEHVEPGNTDCPHRNALQEAIALTKLSRKELEGCDVDIPPEDWPCLEQVVERLQGQYAELLGLPFADQPEDYLLWEGVDVRSTYGRGPDPDCEHLCIGVLALEGVVTKAVSANWDGLVEDAVTQLTGDLDHYVQIVVLPEEARDGPSPLQFVKFHGCAIRATESEEKYRSAFVATRNQITSYRRNHAHMADKLDGLVRETPTLVLGLSIQDENLQSIFSEATAGLPWDPDSDPPAFIFSSGDLGNDYRNVLRSVYGGAYQPNHKEIDAQAVVRAYAKQLLTALVLFTLTDKLAAYAAVVDGPELSAGEQEQLTAGLHVLAGRLAAVADPDPLDFVLNYVSGQARALQMFRKGTEPAENSTLYERVGDVPSSRIPTEADLDGGGMRELSTALALMGKAESDGRCTVGAGSVGSGARGALTLSSANSEVAVFFARDSRAAAHLKINQIVDPDADDVVVIYSSDTASPMTRWPTTRLGRPGEPRVREVNMHELLNQSDDLDSLEANFREAILL